MSDRPVFPSALGGRGDSIGSSVPAHVTWSRIAMDSPWSPAPWNPGPEKRDDAWDLVVKVKYNDTLKRFNGRVNGQHCDHDLAALRSKIASAFKFTSDAEFILTYTDEDGDVVLLDDDNDLCDAAINQKLNPLRINVQLKSSNAGAPRTKHGVSNSRCVSSATPEDELVQVKSAIDDALKFVPEQVPAVLAKLSHDLRSRAASSAPSLAELLDCFAKLMTANSIMQPSSGPVNGSSCSSSAGPQALRSTKLKHGFEFMTGSASQPSDMQHTESSKAPDLKGVLPEDSKARLKQALVDDLIFVSSDRKKPGHKGTTGTGSKGRYDYQSKGKSAISSAVPPVSTAVYGATPIQYNPTPSVGENKLRHWPNLGYMTYGSNGKINDDSSIFPSPSVVPPYYRHLEDNGKVNGDWPPPPYFPPLNMLCPPKLNVPMPESTGLYPFGTSYRDNDLYSCKNLEDMYSFGSSYNYGSVPQHALHRWIQCDGCGVTPIAGPRFKSIVKDDYDLCGTCFSRMGSEYEFTRLDRPASNQTLGRVPKPKVECRFIKDVTVPDGTPMAPSTPFTKIWRMRNSGCTTWPFGTQLLWVGGDQFEIQSSVKLGLSANGCAMGQEIDLGVDFVAPLKPGRYISYWRLALPSGQKFGQRVWVLIQVKEPFQTSDNNQSAAINLNLPPATNSKELKPSVDMKSVPTDPIIQYPQSTRGEMLTYYYTSTVHAESEPASPTGPLMYKEYEPASTALPSVPTATEQMQVPTTDPQTSSAGAGSTLMHANVPAPVVIPLPESVSVSAPVVPHVSVPDPAPVAPPVSVPTASLPDEINHMEEKLLKELERMGFGQVDLNKEILRQNKYDLEQSLDELWCIIDWEMSQLDFDDAEVAAEDGGGRIKRLVLNLLARAKRQ